MKLKSLVSLPVDIWRRWHRARPAAPAEPVLTVASESARLAKVPSVPCDAAPLGALTESELQAVFSSDQFKARWEQDRPELNAMPFPERSWGINPGDRRALHYLVQAFKPRLVLEIGTHIGCSTMSMALALRGQGQPQQTAAELHTVDICDMNDPVAQLWLAHGAPCSPAHLCERARCNGIVNFHASDSVAYLQTCQLSFDLIFLDGVHFADQVYREIPLALARLNAGGFIVLHDYFPALKPLWPDGSLIPGPYLAVQRLQNEGAKLTALPLGSLPWPTKQCCNLTSLAVLVRAN
jgi:predicted O-methyltransferase YrrM